MCQICKLIKTPKLTYYSVDRQTDIATYRFNWLCIPWSEREKIKIQLIFSMLGRTQFAFEVEQPIYIFFFILSFRAKF